MWRAPAVRLEKRTGTDMKKVSEVVYDGGSAGGDGNVTSVSEYAGDSDTRLTTYTYDFRNRRTRPTARWATP